VACQDLFNAGGDSVDNTLGFCLLYMVLHPHVQSAVQRELDSVVGRDRRPTVEDKHRLVSKRTCVLRIRAQRHESKAPRFPVIDTKLR
jgi:cytochrome P450